METCTEHRHSLPDKTPDISLIFNCMSLFLVCFRTVFVFIGIHRSEGGRVLSIPLSYDVT
jgi:hypothetical protein